MSEVKLTAKEISQIIGLRGPEVVATLQGFRGKTVTVQFYAKGKEFWAVVEDKSDE